jgi:hypothetical protein
MTKDHTCCGPVPGAARGKTTVSVISNRLNYCVIIIVNTQFTNVLTAGHKIHPGGPRAGDPCPKHMCS